jgi:hypothetical protein
MIPGKSNFVSLLLTLVNQEAAESFGDRRQSGWRIRRHGYREDWPGSLPMRSSVVLVVGLLALFLQPQSSPAQLILPYPQNDSVKLRLEIEIRGVLSVTEKAVTITNKETIFEWVEVEQSRDLHGRILPASGPILQRQSRQVDKVWVLELDDNLKKVAQPLDGKEAVVLGKCLVLGVESRAQTSKATPAVLHRVVQFPRGAGPVDVPTMAPEGFATSVVSQLQLDSTVTVLSLKAK